MTDKNEPIILEDALEQAVADTEHAPSFEERLRGIAAQIELGMNCSIRIGFSEKRGDYFVQIECIRMDVITKKVGPGRSGKYWPSPHSTRNEIVQAIFGLYKGYWEHEARENFQYRGKRVFGPHMDVDEIWTVAHKVDVRSLKHVEDQDTPAMTALKALADESQRELRQALAQEGNTLADAVERGDA